MQREPAKFHEGPKYREKETAHVVGGNLIAGQTGGNTVFRRRGFRFGHVSTEIKGDPIVRVVTLSVSTTGVFEIRATRSSLPRDRQMRSESRSRVERARLFFLHW